MAQRMSSGVHCGLLFHSPVGCNVQNLSFDNTFFLERASCKAFIKQYGRRAPRDCDYMEMKKRPKKPNDITEALAMAVSACSPPGTTHSPHPELPAPND